uniref:Uncharacterized protein n=1 Tax=Cacopsylla melanoneura TaxID=428564 RepID=A0A8D8VGA5_9HEMI
MKLRIVELRWRPKSGKCSKNCCCNDCYKIQGNTLVIYGEVDQCPFNFGTEYLYILNVREIKWDQNINVVKKTTNKLEGYLTVFFFLHVLAMVNIFQFVYPTIYYF